MRHRTLTALCIALAIGWGASAHANLVVNGGFEATPLTTNGWSITGTGVGVDSTNPHTGLNDAVFTSFSNDPSPGTLSQTLNTIAGQNYNLTFFLLDSSGFFLDSF